MHLNYLQHRCTRILHQPRNKLINFNASATKCIIKIHPVAKGGTFPIISSRPFSKKKPPTSGFGVLPALLQLLYHKFHGPFAIFYYPIPSFDPPLLSLTTIFLPPDHLLGIRLPIHLRALSLTPLSRKKLQA